ncbi:hypothetical protein ACO34A_25840 (plasmid) [Rhizobium sp. ACO-34A]|nr:hypothetical protein ACO34A_25840 [Rhizobium sp. ACO-34A]
MALRPPTGIENLSAIMLGPVPSICKWLILSTWVDPPRKAEGDGGRESRVCHETGRGIVGASLFFVAAFILASELTND